MNNSEKNNHDSKTTKSIKLFKNVDVNEYAQSLLDEGYPVITAQKLPHAIVRSILVPSKSFNLELKKLKEEFVQIKENISFTTHWDKSQKITAGGYLNITSKENVYGIDKDEFIESYQIIDTQKTQTSLDEIIERSMEEWAEDKNKINYKNNTQYTRDER